MSSGANVGSIDAVRHFRAVMHTFAQEARESLNSFDVEVQRTLNWLLDEMPQRWKSELRQCDEALQQARIDLERCRNTPLPGGGTPSCVEQKKALDKAKARRQYAEEKSEATRRWGNVAQREAAEYSGRSNQLSSLFDAELPRAIVLLDRLLGSLEAYRSLQVQSTEAPLATSAAAGTEAETAARPAPAPVAAGAAPATPATGETGAPPPAGQAAGLQRAHTEESGQTAAPGRAQP